MAAERSALVSHLSTFSPCSGYPARCRHGAAARRQRSPKRRCTRGGLREQQPTVGALHCPAVCDSPTETHALAVGHGTALALCPVGGLPACCNPSCRGCPAAGDVACNRLGAAAAGSLSRPPQTASCTHALLEHLVFFVQLSLLCLLAALCPCTTTSAGCHAYARRRPSADPISSVV